jgi:hypothetical protein
LSRNRRLTRVSIFGVGHLANASPLQAYLGSNIRVWLTQCRRRATIGLPALVLVHEGGLANDSWELTVEEIHRLAPELTVLVLDMPVISKEFDAELAEQDLQTGAAATAQCGGEDGSVEFLSDVKPLPVDIHWELIQSPFSAFFASRERPPCRHCHSKTRYLERVPTLRIKCLQVCRWRRNSWWVRAGPWACRSSS